MGLSIFGKIYEECFPIESELGAESEEFKALFSKFWASMSIWRKDSPTPKTHEWYRELYLDITGKSNFFRGKANYPSNYDFYHCKDFLKKLNEKFFGLMRRKDLAIFHAFWLSEVIFAGSKGKKVRPSCIYLAYRMAFGERFALVPALVSYLYDELQTVAFLVRLRIFFKHGLYTIDVDSIS